MKSKKKGGLKLALLALEITLAIIQIAEIILEHLGLID